MKYKWIISIILGCLFLVCEVNVTHSLTQSKEADLEEIQLKNIKGAEREGDTLKLQTQSGFVTFKDLLDVGENSRKYYLFDFLDTPNKFYLIRISGYESRGYVLVSFNSGQTIDLYSTPCFSPEGERFVEVSLDLEAGFLPNLIRIYKLTGSKYTKEWEYIYQDRKGPSNPVWLNSSEIVFFETSFEKVPSDPNLKKTPFLIERKNKEWTKPKPLR